jgi:hypothetical protein
MPLTDLTGTQALSQAVGPFGSLLGGKSFPSSYEFAKRFVANSTTAQGSGNNGVTSLDDPTYLGFSLMFDITSPLFNGATLSNVTTKSTFTDDAFGKIDQFLDNPGAALSGLTGVDNFLGVRPNADPAGPAETFPDAESAVAYLSKIGEENRAQYLKAFVQGLQEVVKTRPYYFQTITGLIESWQKSIEFSEDPFTGSADKEGIAIGCLEAIDLKMTALFNLYRMAVYDVRYKRFVLPKNLMRFTVYVDVHEIRKFKTVRNWIKALNPSDTTTNTIDYVNENTSSIRFKFNECIFDAGASGKAFDGVTNVGGNITTSEIKWGYGTMELISSYSGIDAGLPEDKRQTKSGGIKSALKNFAKDQLMNAANGAVNKIGRTVSSAIQGTLLGNVFGLRHQLLGTLANPQGLLNAALGAAVQGNDLQTYEGKPQPSIAENPLGEATPINNSLTGGTSAFDPSTQTLGGISSINAFGPSGPEPNESLTSSNIFN